MDILGYNETKRNGYRVGDLKTGILEDTFWKRANGQTLDASNYPAFAALKMVYPNTLTNQSPTYSLIGDRWDANASYAGQTGLLCASSYFGSSGVTTYAICNYVSPDLSYAAGKIHPRIFSGGGQGAAHRVSFAGIAYQNGVYSTVKTNQAYRTSNDTFTSDGYLTFMGSRTGLTFNQIVPGDYTQLNISLAQNNVYFTNSLAAGGGKFLMIAGDGANGTTYIYTSTDGKNYTGTVASASFNTTVLNPITSQVSYAQGYFWLCYDSTTVYKSTDGISWGGQIVPTTTRKIIDANGVLFGYPRNASTSYMISTNGGSSWTTKTFPSSIQVQGIHYINGMHVVIGDNRTYFTSTDGGNNWTSRFLPGIVISGVAQGASAASATRIVVHAGFGVLYISDNGTSWRTKQLQCTSLMRYTGDSQVNASDTGYVRIEYIGNKFFIYGIRQSASSSTIGGLSHIYYSSDGEFWGHNVSGPVPRSWNTPAQGGYGLGFSPDCHSIISTDGGQGMNSVYNGKPVLVDPISDTNGSLCFNAMAYYNGQVYRLSRSALSGSTNVVVSRSSDGGLTFDESWVLPGVSGIFNTMIVVSGLLILYAIGGGIAPMYLESSTNTWKILFNDTTVYNVGGDGTSVVLVNNTTTVRTINATTFAPSTVSAPTAMCAIVYVPPNNNYIVTPSPGTNTSYTWNGASTFTYVSNTNPNGSSSAYNTYHTLVWANNFVYQIPIGSNSSTISWAGHNISTWSYLSSIGTSFFTSATTGHGATKISDGIIIAHNGGNTFSKFNGGTSIYLNSNATTNLVSQLLIQTPTFGYCIPPGPFTTQATVSFNPATGVKINGSPYPGNYAQGVIPMGDTKWTYPCMLNSTNSLFYFSTDGNPTTITTLPMPGQNGTYGVIGSTLYFNLGVGGRQWYYTTDGVTLSSGESNWQRGTGTGGSATPFYKFTDGGIYIVESTNNPNNMVVSTSISYGNTPLSVTPISEADFSTTSVFSIVGDNKIVRKSNGAGTKLLHSAHINYNNAAEERPLPYAFGAVNLNECNGIIKIATDTYVNILSVAGQSSQLSYSESIMSQNSAITKLPVINNTLVRVL